MLIIIALAVLSVWALVATVIELPRDGHRAVPTDWARVADHDRPAPCAVESPLQSTS